MGALKYVAKKCCQSYTVTIRFAKIFLCILKALGGNKKNSKQDKANNIIKNIIIIKKQ